MQDQVGQTQDSLWFNVFYLGNAHGGNPFVTSVLVAERRAAGPASWSSMQLLRLGVEPRRTVRVISLRDVSDRPAAYYI